MKYPQAYVFVKRSAREVDLALIERCAAAPCYYASRVKPISSIEQRIKFLIKTIGYIGKDDLRWGDCIVINCNELNIFFTTAMAEHISRVAWVNSTHELNVVRSIMTTKEQLGALHTHLTEAKSNYDEIVTMLGTTFPEFKRDDKLINDIQIYLKQFDFFTVSKAFNQKIETTLRL